MANAARKVVWFGYSSGLCPPKRALVERRYAGKCRNHVTRRKIGIYFSAVTRFTQQTNNFNL